MSKSDIEKKEKNCVALGGLEGAEFHDVLGEIRADLKKLKRFVDDSCAAVDVAPGPMVSLGHEVQEDILKVEHVERSLLDAVSQLITLVAMTRTAAAKLELANKA
jgi:hypothetical protein